jgi:hypothetical protein
MEYYSALKSDEVLSHTTIWPNLENIILNGKGYTYTHKGQMYHSTYMR